MYKVVYTESALSNLEYFFVYLNDYYFFLYSNTGIENESLIKESFRIFLN